MSHGHSKNKSGSHGSHQSGAHFDVAAAARRVVMEAGFEPDIDAAAKEQLDRISAPAPIAPEVKDLRDLPWSSIDNTESRDLDQLEVAEELSTGAIRILVAVADVDALVTKDSPADSHAQENSTSVYTGVQVFPMLPEQFSTNLTSLNENADRVAVVIENVIEKNGDVSSFDVYRSIVRNKAQLAYDETGAWLENTTGGTVQPPEKVAKTQGLAVQLRLQWEAAKRLKAERERNGALELETIEATPVAKNGRVVDLTLTLKSAARDLIEDFMIASNIAIAKWLEARGRSGIRRIVREPERWARIVELASQYGETLPAEPDSLALAKFLAKRRAADPLRFPDLSLAIVKLMGPGAYALDLPGKDPGGHFGLAAHDYTHATAPNRRFADLITQRLVKATLAGTAAPYSDEQLGQLAQHCTEREDAARKVERTMRKVAAALMLADHIGENYDAIVTGRSSSGTYVRLLHPPAEGRVVRGEKGMDVGDRVQVKLLGTNAEKGWIDFGRAER